MKYSKGIMWLDDCRIPFVDNEDIDLDKKLPIQEGGTIYGNGNGFYRTTKITEYKPLGRFTPNLLVCDDMLNDGSIGKSNDHKWIGEDTSDIYGKYNNRTRNQVYSDKGTNSRYYDLDKWFDKVIDGL
jgi:primase-polymerase (primpol)-like protein